MGQVHVKWKNEPDINLVSRNLFRRELANICTSRNEFFLNRVIPICHKKLDEAKSVNCFKAGLDGMEIFIASIRYKKFALVYNYYYLKKSINPV